MIICQPLFRSVLAGTLLHLATACSNPNSWDESNVGRGAEPASDGGSGNRDGTAASNGGDIAGGSGATQDAGRTAVAEAGQPGREIDGGPIDQVANPGPNDAGASTRADSGPDGPPSDGMSPWPGKQGTMVVAESDAFDLGAGSLRWSVAGGQQGYFSSNESEPASPKATFANLTAASKCGPMYSGYTGLTSARDLKNAEILPFSTPTPSIQFGTRKDSCNMGLLVFKQDGRYGLIDFLSIDQFKLTFNYWLGDPGVTDFSNAPIPREETPSCPPGMNPCGGVCVPNSAAACGPACRACSAPPGGTASCRDGQCTYCNPGFRPCGSQCNLASTPCP